MKIFFLLVYLFKGELVVYKQAFNSPAECEAAGKLIIEKQLNDPGFNEGYFAACIPAKGVSA